MSSSILRTTAAALVLVFLAAGAAQAWPAVSIRPSLPARESPARLAAAWDWLASLFRWQEPKPAGTPAGAPEKEGCSADPNGHPGNCR